MSDTPIRSTNKLVNEMFNLLLGNKDSDIKCSLSDSLDDSSKRVNEAIKTSVAMKDSYGNSLTATGSEDKVKSFTKYGFNNDTLNFSLWTALYNDSWVFKKAIDKPAEDMVRCGIKIQGDGDYEKVMKEWRKATPSFIKLLKWGRLYGGSVAFMQFEGFQDEDYLKPIKQNEEKVKKAKIVRMYVTDRWYGVAEQGTDRVKDMTSIDFGKPTKYAITYPNGQSVTVHHDYILRFENRDAPNLVKNGMLQGWGYAEGAHILNEIARDDQLKSAVTSLVNKSLIEVIKMAGMRGAFMGADKDNEVQLTKRLEMVNWARTYNSLTFLDKDDDYQEHGFGGLGGLADLIDKNMILVAAAVDMPGILFGDTSQGFAVDKDAMKRYSQVIHGLDEDCFRLIVEKFLSIMFIRHGINKEVDFEFKSLIEKEEQDEQIDRYKTFIELISKLLEDGIFEPSDYAKCLQKYVAEGIVDFGLDDEQLKKIDENTKNEMENLKGALE